MKVDVIIFFSKVITQIKKFNFKMEYLEQTDLIFKLYYLKSLKIKFDKIINIQDTLNDLLLRSL